VLALAPYPRWPAMLIRKASPLLAIFYLAAILERAARYTAFYSSIGVAPRAVNSRLARGR
jgi:hypothetical protein